MEDNRNVEVLNIDSNNIKTPNDSVTVINTESISIDQNGQVDPISIEYNEYRNKLNNCYLSSKEEQTIISEFVVDNQVCHHTLTVRNLDGTKIQNLANDFSYQPSFKQDFLVNMVEDYLKYNDVCYSNIVSSENNLVDFIASTKENDTLTIKNIDKELASQINDIIYNQNKNNSNLKDSKELLHMINERGNGNYLVIGLTIVLIAVTLIGTIFFTIMSSK